MSKKTEELEIKVAIEDMDAKQVINLLNILFSRQKLLNASIQADNFYVDQSLVDYLKEDKPDSVSKVKENAARQDMTKGFHFTENAIVFTGFPLTNELGAANAYCTIAAMVVSQARNSKRTTAKIVEAENEKYAARIWLNQLGLSGRGGKSTREIFLKHLKGDSAFRTPESKQRWQDKRCK